MESFSYRPLDQARLQIRLLTPVTTSDELAFELKAASLLPETKPTYRTVSYCWGDPTPCRKTNIDGKSLLVPEGTYQVLRCIIAHKDEDRRPLWIDAVCINQEDMEERASQVALMGRVYAGGEQNLVYLGEGDEITEKAVTNLQDIVREIRSATGCAGRGRREELEAMDAFFDSHDLNTGQSSVHVDVDAMKSFFQCSWFQRVWVLQEATLARRSTCLIGEHTVKLEDVLDTAVWILRYLSLSLPAGVATSPGLAAASAMWGHSALHSFRGGKPTGRLANTLRKSGRFECSDERDRVFGVLGLTHGNMEIPRLLKPNYQKSKEEVFRDAVRYCVEHEGSREVFAHISHRPGEDIISETGCPSWVPKIWRPLDFRQDATVLRPYREPRDCHAEERIISLDVANPEVLVMRGIVLGQLRFLSPALLRHTEAGEAENFALSFMEVVSMMHQHEHILSNDDLAKTLCADMNHNLSRSNRQDRDKLSALASTVLAGRPIYHWDNLPSDADAEIKDATAFYAAMYWACRNRKFAVTRKGSTGLVPQVCREGDTLALLSASSRPMILRKRDDGTGDYLLLGECYIDGIMYDDEVERLQQQGQEEIFRLR